MKEGINLLKAAQKLDEEALTAIFDQFAPAIYKYTLRLCHDQIVADNIVGDVFAQLLEQFGLWDRRGDAAETWSRGMKQKLALMCTLLHHPQILFLDEPTNGVDPVSRRDFWRILYQLLKEGVTIFVTTAYLDEADRLCDRLAIIDSGRIKALGSPSELKAGLGGDIISLTVGASETACVDRLASELKGLPFVRAIGTKQNGLEIRVESPEKALPVVLEAANRAACRLEFIDYHRPRLDDVFVALTGHAIREEFPKAEEP